MASCFHCGTGSPVGVCARCNALVCANDGVRPTRFRCTSCGSAQAAAAAVVQSPGTTGNPLARSLVDSALLPGETPEQLARISVGALVASGAGLRAFPGMAVESSVADVAGAVREFRQEIDVHVETSPVEPDPSVDTLADLELLPPGVDTPRDAIAQARELWWHLEDRPKSTMAFALLMLDGALPQTWPVEMVILRSALDPRPGEAEPSSWG